MVNILKQVKSIFSKKSKEIIIKANPEVKIYWTEKGKNYHSDKNCISLLRSKDIIEGTKDNCPKESLCSNCKK